MAEIQPFRAYRYNPGKVGALKDVVAPPYDVIDDDLRSTLAARHAKNIVHVDLPKPGPEDFQGLDDRYDRAGRMWKDWVREGTVKQDSARGLYVYHQEFDFAGSRHVRKGFLARVRLQPFNDGTILPHEETFAGPKADRLRLMEATGMNLSPVFGLYPDAGGEIQSQLDAAVGQQPPAEATDDLGVVGRLWPVTDQQVISKVVGLMGPRMVLIADGHHRYETAVQFRDQTIGESAVRPNDAPVRFALMDFVSMQDPGLLVLPTHRLIRGIGGITATELTTALERHFDVKTVGTGAAAAQSAWDQLSAEVGQGGLAFGVTGGTWLIARPRDLEIMAELAKDHGAEWRRLSVSVLHRLVLGRLIRPARPEFEIDYVHQLRETTEAITARRCELTVLVPPSTVGEVERLAVGGEKMPQKSTYFYPKLQTGFVFNPLWTN